MSWQKSPIIMVCWTTIAFAMFFALASLRNASTVAIPAALGMILTFALGVVVYQEMMTLNRRIDELQVELKDMKASK